MNSKGPVMIRVAGTSDIPKLRELAQTIWRACYPRIISAEQIEFMLGWMYCEEEIRRQIENGVTWELIETKEGGPVGFLSYHSEPDGRVKLEKLYVLPTMQGMGIGSCALAHVLEQAKRMGATAVWMQVNKKNQQAVAAYRKAGFRVAQEAVFEIGGGFVMDDYLMERAV